MNFPSMNTMQSSQGIAQCQYPAAVQGDMSTMTLYDLRTGSVSQGFNQASDSVMYVCVYNEQNASGGVDAKLSFKANPAELEAYKAPIYCVKTHLVPGGDVVSYVKQNQVEALKALKAVILGASQQSAQPSQQPVQQQGMSMPAGPQFNFAGSTGQTPQFNGMMAPPPSGFTSFTNPSSQPQMSMPAPIGGAPQASTSNSFFQPPQPDTSTQHPSMPSIPGMPPMGGVPSMPSIPGMPPMGGAPSGMPSIPGMPPMGGAPSGMPSIPGMPPMGGIPSGMPSMGGIPSGMPSMGGAPSGMPSMGGAPSGMPSIPGMPPIGGAPSMGSALTIPGMPPMGGAPSGMPPMGGAPSGMPSMGGIPSGQYCGFGSAQCDPKTCLIKLYSNGNHNDHNKIREIINEIMRHIRTPEGANVMHNKSGGKSEPKLTQKTKKLYGFSSFPRTIDQIGPVMASSGNMYNIGAVQNNLKTKAEKYGAVSKEILDYIKAFFTLVIEYFGENGVISEEMINNLSPPVQMYSFGGMPGMPTPSGMPSIPGIPGMPTPSGMPSIPGIPGMPTPSGMPSIPGMPPMGAPSGIPIAPHPFPQQQPHATPVTVVNKSIYYYKEDIKKLGHFEETMKNVEALVVDFSDGDTFQVGIKFPVATLASCRSNHKKHGGKQMCLFENMNSKDELIQLIKVRCWGIDAAEYHIKVKGEPMQTTKEGWFAQLFLMKFFQKIESEGADLRIDLFGHDVYGRVLGDFKLNGISVNQEMLKVRYNDAPVACEYIDITHASPFSDNLTKYPFKELISDPTEIQQMNDAVDAALPAFITAFGDYKKGTTDSVDSVTSGLSNMSLYQPSAAAPISIGGTSLPAPPAIPQAQGFFQPPATSAPSTISNPLSQMGLPAPPASISGMPSMPPMGLPAPPASISGMPSMPPMGLPAPPTAPMGMPSLPGMPPMGMPAPPAAPMGLPAPPAAPMGMPSLPGMPPMGMPNMSAPAAPMGMPPMGPPTGMPNMSAPAAPMGMPNMGLPAPPAMPQMVAQPLYDMSQYSNTGSSYNFGSEEGDDE